MKAALAAAAIACAVAPAMASARPGDLDPAFATGGVAAPVLPADVSGTTDVQPVGTQPGGGVIVAGSLTGQDCSRIGCIVFSRSIVVQRLLPGGAPDPTFGNGGKVVSDFGLGVQPNIFDAALDPSGRILVAASGQNGPAVVRLTADGQLDSSFSGDGIANVTLPAGFGASDMEVGAQSDGRPVVVTSSFNPPSTLQLDLARLETNGDPDAGFAGDGPVAAPPNGRQILGDLLVDSQDRLVISRGTGVGAAGASWTEEILRRAAGGNADAGFAGGVVSLPGAHRQEVAPNLALGAADSITTIFDGTSAARVKTDGSLDGSFGSGGVAAIPGVDNPASSALRTVAVQSDGSVLSSSVDGYFGGIELRLVRLTPSGALDNGFGEGGQSVVYRDGATTFGTGILVLAGDRALVTVDAYRSMDAIAARYRLDAGGPDDLDADGVVDADDKCPGRYGPSGGCPKVERKLKLQKRADKKRIYASLTGGACAYKERVELYAKKRGRDPLVGSGITKQSVSESKAGIRLKLKKPTKGPVYAKVRRTLEPTAGICGKATSPAKRVTKK